MISGTFVVPHLGSSFWFLAKRSPASCLPGLFCMCALCLWTSGSYWFERGLRLFLIFCMCSRFCMCMCVALLSVRSCLHSLLLDFGLSTCCFACSVFDSHHHSLAPYFKCYGSDFADLVLRIKPVGVVLLSIICFLETARSIYFIAWISVGLPMVLARVSFVHMPFPHLLSCLRHLRACLFG